MSSEKDTGNRLYQYIDDKKTMKSHLNFKSILKNSRLKEKIR
jgi:hypothetical protein